MIIIENEDDAYLSWLQANPDGFVINVEKQPRVASTRLHRSGCRHISTPERTNWTTNDYKKVCSNQVDELEQWATQVIGSLPACQSCKPTNQAEQSKFECPPNSDDLPNILKEQVAIALPFDTYPQGGRQLLGRRSVTNSRRGYGLALRKLTNQSKCAYCEIDLFEQYELWLLLQTDHVVPTSMGKRLGISSDWLEDYCNLVLACSACNSFANQFDDLSVTDAPASLDEFFDLRNQIFFARKPVILDCQRNERAFFDGQPWHAY